MVNATRQLKESAPRFCEPFGRQLAPFSCSKTTENYYSVFVFAERFKSYAYDFLVFVMPLILSWLHTRRSAGGSQDPTEPGASVSFGTAMINQLGDAVVPAKKELVIPVQKVLGSRPCRRAKNTLQRSIRQRNTPLPKPRNRRLVSASWYQ